MRNQFLLLRTCACLVIYLLAFYNTTPAQALPEDPILGPADRTLGAWQNPNVGFVFDMVVDASAIEGSEWTTQGFKIRSA
jgi:hypothetical protein